MECVEEFGHAGRERECIGKMWIVIGEEGDLREDGGIK